MTKSQKILVVGATGYLGRAIIRRLQQDKRDFIALARNSHKLQSLGVSKTQIMEVQVTNPLQLKGICDGIEVVISCLGITRQRDGVSYLDVDYQANLNVLLEAEKSGVKRFIYVSAFKAQCHPKVRLLRAKEQFAARLLSSEKLSPCVIRPNGFFADLEEFYHMATKGRIYQFGDGSVTLNPIDGDDLARFCVRQIETEQNEYDIGGPEILTLKQIARLAFESQNKPVSIVSLPDWFRRAVLILVAKLPEQWGGAPEFFLTMLGGNAVAPCYGVQTIGKHFALLGEKLDGSASS